MKKILAGNFNINLFGFTNTNTKLDGMTSFRYNENWKCVCVSFLISYILKLIDHFRDPGTRMCECVSFNYFVLLERKRIEYSISEKVSFNHECLVSLVGGRWQHPTPPYYIRVYLRREFRDNAIALIASLWGCAGNGRTRENQNTCK